MCHGIFYKIMQDDGGLSTKLKPTFILSTYLKYMHVWFRDAVYLCPSSYVINSKSQASVHKRVINTG